MNQRLIRPRRIAHERKRRNCANRPEIIRLRPLHIPRQIKIRRSTRTQGIRPLCLKYVPGHSPDRFAVHRSQIKIPNPRKRPRPIVRLRKCNPAAHLRRKKSRQRCRWLARQGHLQHRIAASARARPRKGRKSGLGILRQNLLDARRRRRKKIIKYQVQ